MKLQLNQIVAKSTGGKTNAILLCGGQCHVKQKSLEPRLCRQNRMQSVAFLSSSDDSEALQADYTIFAV